MNFVRGSLGKRAARIKSAVNTATQVILGVLGLAFLRSEIERVSRLPHDLSNYLYIALLVSILFLIAGWILVSRKELDTIGEWLDPPKYVPPDETIAVFGITVILVALAYSSRNAILFGTVYSLYAAANLIAVIHLRTQMKVIIDGSRMRLQEEPSESARLWKQAIDLLDIFYLKRPNIKRVLATLFLGLAGLGLSLLARKTRQRLELYAYCLYLTSVVVLEGAIMLFWRLRLYGGLRPLDAEWYEYERRTSGSRD